MNAEMLLANSGTPQYEAEAATDVNNASIQFNFFQPLFRCGLQHGACVLPNTGVTLDLLVRPLSAVL